MRLFWSERARTALRGIQDEIAAEQPKAARRITHAVEDTALLVARWPFVGRPSSVETVRTFAVPGTNYIIAYTAGTRGVTVVTVFHGAQDWQRRPPF